MCVDILREDGKMIKEILVAISAVISTATLVYTTFFKKKREKKIWYYEKILYPFINEYRKDEAIDSIKFMKQQIMNIEECDNIPKYILYLIKNNNGQELTNVLICDYIENYDNESGTMSRISKGILKISMYIVFFTIYAYIILFAIELVLILWNLIDALCKGNVCQYFQNNYSDISLAFVCIIVAFLLDKGVDWFDKDDYTIKVKQIEKIIKKKSEFTKQNKDKYIF